MCLNRAQEHRHGFNKGREMKDHSWNRFWGYLVFGLSIKVSSLLGARIWLNDNKALTFIQKCYFWIIATEKTFTFPIFSFEFVFQAYAISNHRSFSVRFIRAYEPFASIRIQFTQGNETKNRDLRKLYSSSAYRSLIIFDNSL